MSTISIPLTPELEKKLDAIAHETDASKSAIMRLALARYSDELAIQKVLIAKHEPTLTGNLDDLLDIVS